MCKREVCVCVCVPAMCFVCEHVCVFVFCTGVCMYMPCVCVCACLCVHMCVVVYVCVFLWLKFKVPVVGACAETRVLCGMRQRGISLVQEVFFFSVIVFDMVVSSLLSCSLSTTRTSDPFEGVK